MSPRFASGNPGNVHPLVGPQYETKAYVGFNTAGVSCAGVAVSVGESLVGRNFLDLNVKKLTSGGARHILLRKEFVKEIEQLRFVRVFEPRL